MWTKLTNSWELVKASAQVLQADKELIVFPLISAVAVAVVSVSFFVPIFVVEHGVELFAEGAGEMLAYPLIFLFYVVQYTVIFFFNSALVGAAMIRLEGGNPTLGDGLRIAFRRFSAIVGYALIAATVGMVLRAVRERSNFLAGIVVGLVGMAWSLATFLVVPVLVTRDVGPLAAIKESAAVLKKTWGEQVAGNVGLGFVFGLLYVALALLAVPALILAATSGEPALLIPVVAFFVLAFILLAVVNATLSAIYSAALYRFATTGDGGRFDSSLLDRAFVAKG